MLYESLAKYLVFLKFGLLLQMLLVLYHVPSICVIPILKMCIYD